MKQAINLTGKAAGAKKAAKSKAKGQAPSESGPLEAGQGQITSLQQPDRSMYENLVITLPKPSAEVKTRAKANSKRVSNENLEPKASFEAEELAVEQIQGTKKSIRSTRAAKLAEKQKKVLSVEENSEERKAKGKACDESIGN